MSHLILLWSIANDDHLHCIFLPHHTWRNARFGCNLCHASQTIAKWCSFNNWKKYSHRQPKNDKCTNIPKIVKTIVVSCSVSIWKGTKMIFPLSNHHQHVECSSDDNTHNPISKTIQTHRVIYAFRKKK